MEDFLEIMDTLAEAEVVLLTLVETEMHRDQTLLVELVEMEQQVI
jgi:hypothetical protein